MTIEASGGLGRRLDVANPVEVDLGELDPEAGELLARGMAEGKSREEAIANVLNRAARVLQPGVVHIDYEKIVDKRPEVGEVVKELMTEADIDPRKRRLTVGQALTRLIVDGATHYVRTHSGSDRPLSGPGSRPQSRPARPSRPAQPQGNKPGLFGGIGDFFDDLLS